MELNEFTVKVKSLFFAILQKTEDCDCLIFMKKG